MLRKVVEIGTGKAANISQNVAGKTGTTNDYRDAWFVGFTPDIVTGVWVGNDNNSKLPGITGGAMPARVFANYMKTAIQNFPLSVFDYPKMNGSNTLSPIKMDDVDETVDETEERSADKKAVEKETQDIMHQEQNDISQQKPSKPSKQKQIFDNSNSDLIEYDDEKPIKTSVPLPGA